MASPLREHTAQIHLVSVRRDNLRIVETHAHTPDIVEYHHLQSDTTCGPTRTRIKSQLSASLSSNRANPTKPPPLVKGACSRFARNPNLRENGAGPKSPTPPKITSPTPQQQTDFYHAPQCPPGLARIPPPFGNNHTPDNLIVILDTQR